MRALAIVLLALLLTACGDKNTRPSERLAVAAGCSDLCFSPCVATDGDTGIRITGNPDDAKVFDEIGEDVVGRLTGKLRTCETHRQACELCLGNLRQRGVIQ